MKSWRETIFEKLTTGVSQKTLVVDPDGILADESVQERLISSGFGLIVFDEPLSFRFEFESRFRHKWDSGEKIEVLIISHLSESEFQSVPYDVLCQARIVSFALEDLFPDVSPSVVTALPKEHLDTLQNALQKFQPGRMLENTSIDFIMRHIYGIDAGLISTDVDLLRVLLRRHYHGQVSQRFSEFRENKFTSQFSILGLVVDSVDSIMHGMELGMRGMYNQVEQWQNEGFLGGLIRFLHENGFVVFLTSDHGNIEATGIGSPGEGSIAKVRGERARLYADEGLRKKVHETHGNSFIWEGFGLPGNCFPLLAEGNKSFSPTGKRIVTHGGASLEEVIVPFVEISRN